MKQLFTLLLFTVVDVSIAQNLVPNSGFESTNTCDYGFPSIDTGYFYPSVIGWWSPSSGTPDYFNTCYTNPDNKYSVPENKSGVQYPRTGEGYAGISLLIVVENEDPPFTPFPPLTEYLQTTLTETLQPNVTYCAGAYVNLAGKRSTSTAGSINSVKDWGFLFSDTLFSKTCCVTEYNANDPIDIFIHVAVPQVLIETFITDTTNWVLVADQFIAVGNEKHLSIGNFNLPNNNNYTQLDSFKHVSYMYFDDIFTVPTSNYIFGADTLVCVNQFPLQLEGPANLTDYQWSNGIENATTQINAPGTYYVQAKMGGCIFLDTVVVSAKNISLLPAERSYCETNLPQPLSIEYPSQIFSAFLWSNGDTTATTIVEASGEISVLATGACGLVADTILLSLEPELLFSIGPDTTICNDGALSPITLSSNTNLPNYLWSDGSSEAELEIQLPGLYSLGTSNACGTTTAEAIVTGCEPAVYVPNIFYPNSENTNNQTLLPFLYYARLIKMQIFDRWGNLIFQQVGDGPGWNGQYRGALVGTGVYSYQLSYQSLAGGVTLSKNGTFDLIW